MTARACVVALCGTLAACGGAAPVTTTAHEPRAANGAAAATPPSALAAHRAVTEFAGRYPTHAFQLVQNDCGSDFQNNVPFIVVDGQAQVLYTEGEQRHYDARVEDGELIAEGWFGADQGSVCEGSQFNERWRFHKRPDGGLTGFVEGLWPLAPSHCEHPCRVRFAVETAPSTGEAHAPPRRAVPHPEAYDE